MVVTDDAGVRRPDAGVRGPGARHLTLASLPDSASAPSPRLCLLQREEGESYGFRLRVERGRLGHIIRQVASGGAAERGGLRDGDRVLEVNDRYVDDLPHPEVGAPLHRGNCRGVFWTFSVSVPPGGSEDKVQWKPAVFTGPGWGSLRAGLLPRSRPPKRCQSEQGPRLQTTPALPHHQRSRLRPGHQLHTGGG